MTNLKTLLESRNRTFDEKFKCIQSDCDGQGNIPHQVAEDDWEAEQCQFHAEYLFPIKSYQTETIKLVIEALKEEVEKLPEEPMIFSSVHSFKEKRIPHIKKEYVLLLLPYLQD